MSDMILPLTLVGLIMGWFMWILLKP